MPIIFETRPDNASKYFDIQQVPLERRAVDHAKSASATVAGQYLGVHLGSRRYADEFLLLTEKLAESWFLMLRKWAIRISRSCR